MASSSGAASEHTLSDWEEALNRAEESMRHLSGQCRLQKTGHPDVFCSMLPNHWRSNKSLPAPFVILAFCPIPDGTRVSVSAGNDENFCADVKNNVAEFNGQMARFSDLRFVGKSGRGKNFNLSMTIFTQPHTQLIVVPNVVKVTVDGPRDSRNASKYLSGQYVPIPKRIRSSSGQLEAPVQRKGQQQLSSQERQSDPMSIKFPSANFPGRSSATVPPMPFPLPMVSALSGLFPRLNSQLLVNKLGSNNANLRPFMVPIIPNSIGHRMPNCSMEAAALQMQAASRLLCPENLLPPAIAPFGQTTSRMASPSQLFPPLGSSSSSMMPFLGATASQLQPGHHRSVASLLAAMNSAGLFASTMGTMTEKFGTANAGGLTESVSRTMTVDQLNCMAAKEPKNNLNCGQNFDDRDKQASYAVAEEEEELKAETKARRSKRSIDDEESVDGNDVPRKRARQQQKLGAEHHDGILSNGGRPLAAQWLTPNPKCHPSSLGTTSPPPPQHAQGGGGLWRPFHP